MKLHIVDNNKIIDRAFAEWLIDILRVNLISNVRTFNFERWDNYLNTSTDIIRLYDKTYYVKDIIKFATLNIVCTCNDGELTIYFRHRLC